MIKSIVVTDLMTLDGHEAMDLGIRIATETPYKHVWYSSPLCMVIGNVAWSVSNLTLDDINTIFECNSTGMPMFVSQDGYDVRVTNWSYVVC